jgi:hypothetical protein
LLDSFLDDGCAARPQQLQLPFIDIDAHDVVTVPN